MNAAFHDVEDTDKFSKIFTAKLPNALFKYQINLDLTKMLPESKQSAVNLAIWQLFKKL